MAATVKQILERAKENYARILVLVTQIVSTTGGGEIENPTREQIDDVVTAADTAGIMRPRITNTVGNRTIDWTGYQTFLLQQIKEVDVLIRQADGPFEIKTRGHV